MAAGYAVCRLYGKAFRCGDWVMCRLTAPGEPCSRPTGKRGRVCGRLDAEILPAFLPSMTRRFLYFYF